MHVSFVGLVRCVHAMGAASLASALPTRDPLRLEGLKSLGGGGRHRVMDSPVFLQSDEGDAVVRTLRADNFADFERAVLPSRRYADDSDAFDFPFDRNIERKGQLNGAGA